MLYNKFMTKSALAAALPSSSPALFPIRDLVHRTGVNASTLRAWENRHGLLHPYRAESGHRLYGPADAERVRRIQALLGQGLGLTEISGLLQTDAALAETHTEWAEQAPPAGEGPAAWDSYLRETLRALEDFSTERLDAIYNEACAVYPIDLLTQHVLIPALERIGERWATRPSGIAEEHFFSAWLRNKLGARLHHTSGLSKGRPLLLACLPHEVHEIGLLLFALGALHRGFRVVYLGGNVPIRQLIHVADKSHAAGIVLSGRDTPDAAALLEDIAWLTGATRVPVFVGSHFSVRRQIGLIQANAVPLGGNIVAGLNLLEARLARSGVSKARGA
jgi:DNA-binding transcriptional MerR regulator